MVAMLRFCSSPYEAAENASAICILTEWEQFRALDFDRLAELVATPILLDFRNIYSREEVTRRGFAYSRIGSGSRAPSDRGNAGPMLSDHVSSIERFGAPPKKARLARVK